MAKCYKCGKELPAESNFCFNCGYPVGDIQVFRSCSECGNALSSVDKFCSQCGVPVRVIKAGNLQNQPKEQSKVSLTQLPKTVLVHGGQFVMGSGTSNSLVTLLSFNMGEVPVTQKQYAYVMGQNPSKLKGDNCPVESVNWCEAIIYCNMLSIMHGLTPCYSIGNHTDLSGFEATSPVWKRIECNFAANGFRLPTEAEWEFSARGGINPGAYQYAGSDNINEVAWYGENSAITTHDVATKLSNSLRLYDMCGNVAEWCWDYFANELPAGEQTNPHGPSTGNMHVKRGGSWLDDPQQCTVFFRSGSAPHGKSSSLGFRVCRSEIGSAI